MPVVPGVLSLAPWVAVVGYELRGHRQTPRGIAALDPGYGGSE